MKKDHKHQKPFDNKQEKAIDEGQKKNQDEQIAMLEEEKAALKDEYLRAHAEMENLRKRTAIELEKRSKYAISEFARELLPVADNLDRALKAIKSGNGGAPTPEAVKNLEDGIVLTQKELNSVLEKNGVHKLGAKGKIFDPNFHKVVQELENPSVPAGTVLEEWQTGYTIGDRILREAMVVVAKGGPKGGENNPSEVPAGATVDQTV